MFVMLGNFNGDYFRWSHHLGLWALMSWRFDFPDKSKHIYPLIKILATAGLARGICLLDSNRRYRESLDLWPMLNLLWPWRSLWPENIGIRLLAEDIETTVTSEIWNIVLSQLTLISHLRSEHENCQQSLDTGAGLERRWLRPQA